MDKTNILDLYDTSRENKTLCNRVLFISYLFLFGDKQKWGFREKLFMSNAFQKRKPLRLIHNDCLSLLHVVNLDRQSHMITVTLMRLVMNAYWCDLC